MAVISWGKPRIFIGQSGALSSTEKSYQELSTPVEDSTNLTANEGDKTEATIEGGEAEASKFKAPTFEFTMNVRMAKDRRLPSALKQSNGDGYTSSDVSIILQPEATDAPGILIESASVSVVESYTSADGAMWEFTFAPVVNNGAPAIQWGTITVPTPTTVPSQVGTGGNNYKVFGFTSSNFTKMLKFNGQTND